MEIEGDVPDDVVMSMVDSTHSSMWTPSLSSEKPLKADYMEGHNNK